MQTGKFIFVFLTHRRVKGRLTDAHKIPVWQPFESADLPTSFLPSHFRHHHHFLQWEIQLMHCTLSQKQTMRERNKVRKKIKSYKAAQLHRGRYVPQVMNTGWTGACHTHPIIFTHVTKPTTELTMLSSHKIISDSLTFPGSTVDAEVHTSFLFILVTFIMLIIPAIRMPQALRLKKSNIMKWNNKHVRFIFSTSTASATRGRGE